MDFCYHFSVSKAKLSEYSEKIEALAARLAASVVCHCCVDSYPAHPFCPTSMLNSCIFFIENKCITPDDVFNFFLSESLSNIVFKYTYYYYITVGAA